MSDRVGWPKILSRVLLCRLRNDTIIKAVQAPALKYERGRFLRAAYPMTAMDSISTT